MEIRVQVLEFLQDKIIALRSQQTQLRADSTPSGTIPTVTISNPEQVSHEPSPTIVPGLYQNVSAIRANTMKFFPNFFARHQLTKIFICFPDPHFKQRKHKARIVSASLNAEYAYVLRPGGFLYTITDVEEYHRWILRHFGAEDAILRNRNNGAANDDNNAFDPSEFQAREEEQEQEQEQEQDTEETDEDGVRRIHELWERVTDEELERDECVRVMCEETEEGKKVTRNHGQKFVAVFRRKLDPEWAN
jgi:tRNA (guanine-N7-)-methyltransferase